MKSSLCALSLASLLALSAQQSPPPAQKKAPAKAEATPEPAKPPAPPPEPKERTRYNYVYDLHGRPTPAGAVVQEERRGTGAGTVVERKEASRDPHGQPVAILDSQERVLKDQEGDRTTERVIQRYDPNGRPTSKQLVRTERRKMPDGTVVTTETSYDQDLNGRMQFTERRTTREKKTDAGGTATISVERPTISGATQVVERIDRNETKRGESVTETVSSRKFLEANGRFEERERELSVATKTGELTTTETKKWEAGAAGVSGQMDFVSRSLSRKTEKPDGTLIEDIEVYTTRIAGTTPDLNRTQTPSLEEQVRREKKVQPDGKIVETTSTRLRQVVDPSRLGGLVVETEVITPTAQGKTIETTVSERDANGRMLLVRRAVEEEKK